MENTKEYYDSLDKRSKEYKDYKAEYLNGNVDDIKHLDKALTKEETELEFKEALKHHKNPKGVGDDIEKMLEATGVKSLVHSVFGEDCGCNERRDLLNRLFPYKEKERMNCDEYDYLSELLPTITNTITSGTSEKLLKIYQKYVNSKQKATNCASCWVGIIKVLRGMVASYDNDLREAEQLEQEE